MKTITIQIENSDDKLSQSRWSDFMSEAHSIIGHLCSKIHFFGTSLGNSRWQNACWVVEFNELLPLRERLSSLKNRFKQDSIAITEGTTEFI